MRFVHAALFFVVTASPAFAQREPEIVIPGKPGVPVFINGVDASWAVVEGEFGLDRPGAMAPTVIYRPLVVDFPYAVPAYFPRTGRRPGYGRFEIMPPANRAAAASGADLLSQLVERIRAGPGHRIFALSSRRRWSRRRDLARRAMR